MKLGAELTKKKKLKKIKLIGVTEERGGGSELYVALYFITQIRAYVIGIFNWIIKTSQNAENILIWRKISIKYSKIRTLKYQKVSAGMINDTKQEIWILQ